MNKDPMIYAVAGIVFGFVLGYMAAGLGDHAESRVPPPGAGAPTAEAEVAPAPAAGRARAGAAATPDPNEVRALESLAAREKANVQARIELGNLLMDHSQFDEAARWYREALALAPDNNDVRVDLGACLVSAGKAGEQKCIWRPPTTALTARSRGRKVLQMRSRTMSTPEAGVAAGGSRRPSTRPATNRSPIRTRKSATRKRTKATMRITTASGWRAPGRSARAGPGAADRPDSA